MLREGIEWWGRDAKTRGLVAVTGFLWTFPLTILDMGFTTLSEIN